jgi:hypothetical protein
VSNDRAPISQAHKEALEARRRFFASRPDIKRPVSREALAGALPEALARAFGEEDCSQYLEAANNAYQISIQALLAGDVVTHDAWYNIAQYWFRRYNDCLWLQSTIDPSFPDPK